MAQEAKIIHYSTGSGIVVNNDGYIVTARHVITACQQYEIYQRGQPLGARLVAEHKEHDLALLKTESAVKGVASFHALEEDIPEGAPLILLGYTGNAWRTGKAAVRTARFISMRGPGGEDWIMQFKGETENGNSGGPVVDRAGNVLGLIEGQATMKRMRISTDEVLEVRRRGIAIHPHAIGDFLEKNHVEFSRETARRPLHKERLHALARAYTVNVRCELPPK